MVLCHCPKGGGSAYSAAQLQPSRRQSELCSALVPFPNVPPKLRHLGGARARCSNLGSFHLNVESLSAFRGKSLNLSAEKTFAKRSNTLKSQTYQPQTTAETLLRRLQVQGSFIELLLPSHRADLQLADPQSVLSEGQQ